MTYDDPDALYVDYTRVPVAPRRRERVHTLPTTLANEYNFNPDSPARQPIKYSAKQPGRNESCACGSGMKAKRCHRRPLYPEAYAGTIQYAEQNIPRVHK